MLTSLYRVKQTAQVIYQYIITINIISFIILIECYTLINYPTCSYIIIALLILIILIVIIL